MLKRNIYKYLLSSLILIIFSGFFSGRDDVYFEINKNIDLFGRIYKEVTFNYVDNIDPEEFMRAGIRGMLGSLDPYTFFIDENKKEDFDLITNGKYGGVGISIGIRGDKVTIIDVLDGYSAQKQGLRVGDVLIEAAGGKITPDNADEISSLVKGNPGTMVNLKVLRNGSKDTLSFNLIREEVQVKSLAYYGFCPQKSNNAYLKLINFSRSAGDEVINALKELKTKKEIKSVMLDLRGNPGGLLDVAVNICENFLPKNDLIVSTKGRDEASSKSYSSTQEPLLSRVKLIVLINENSASASEIVAGAIQDHDRGVILGTKSFGKGLVQTITPLDFNTSLKITTAKYYTPSGRCIQKIDYAEHNKAISEIDTVVKSSFLTEHKRLVYGAGGITPDTTIQALLESDIVKDLLAKGLFFQFADHYYYMHPNDKYSSLSDNKLYSDFENYLTEQKYNFHSVAEEQVDRILAQMEGKNSGKSIIEGLSKVKKEFEKLDSGELIANKDEVDNEIRIELSSRYKGEDGKTEESINKDIQFQTALKILSDSITYSKLLNLN
ncbi:MAG: S41 family peptidase [Ignavibacteriaceae bacterium]|jgi:carboxyl-terminal processing protease